MKQNSQPLHPVATGLELPAEALATYPPVERWDDWKEYDPSSWPKKVERRYSLIPTICFNCEAWCGLLAYVDRERLSVKKFEGNRQPVLRVALERQGKKFNFTYEAHREAGLGEVWEEDEFWIELSWVDPVSKVITKGGNTIGVEIDGVLSAGLPTPSRKIEFFSRTLKEWKWPEHALPGYIKSHVHRENIDQAKGEMLLLPTFRLPTLIHTRSGNAKWLYEIPHKNPLWLHTKDAERLGVKTGELLKVHTEIPLCQVMFRSEVDITALYRILSTPKGVTWSQPTLSMGAFPIPKVHHNGISSTSPPGLGGASRNDRGHRHH